MAMSTTLHRLAVTSMALCLAGTRATAQSGSVSDFSGASVSNSALVGPFVPRAAAALRVSPASHAALREIAGKVGVSLNAGTVSGGGFTTSGERVQALGQLMFGPAAAPASVHSGLARALRPSGASEAQIDRLLSALAGLLLNPAASALAARDGAPRGAFATAGPRSDGVGGPQLMPPVDDGTPVGAVAPALLRLGAILPANLSPEAVAEAASAFRDLVNSASAAYLRDPPDEFLATYSTLFELICAQDIAAGIPAPMCTATNFLIDQPPPVPLVNRDSIAAAEHARALAAARARADSIAAAAEHARADSVEVATRATATAHARAVLETKIYFDHDQFALHPNAKTALDDKLQILLANPDVRIRVEGHADAGETGELSRTLGWLRAEQAQSYFIAHGVGEDRISIVNRGTAHAACTNRRESCRFENRRDEFIIVAGGSRMRVP
jgi:peptidoglycan-associated lipoprotein